MARWMAAGGVLLQVCPTVAVVIPETVIIREFLNHGFNVLDLVHVRLPRATKEGLAKTEDLARKAFAVSQVAIQALARVNGAVVSWQGLLTLISGKDSAGQPRKPYFGVAPAGRDRLGGNKEVRRA